MILAASAVCCSDCRYFPRPCARRGSAGCRADRVNTLEKQDSTHRPLSRSFSGLPDRILDISHKKELLRGLEAYG